MVIGKVDFYSTFSVTAENAGAVEHPERPGVHIVKRGDTVTSLARKYGLTNAQFKQWVGLKDDNIQIGQEIVLPQAEVPQGKGLDALRTQYNMSKEAFCKLNSIPVSSYSVYSQNLKPGEKFYVFRGLGTTKTNTTSRTASKTTASPNTSSSGGTRTTNGFTVVQCPNEGYWTVKASEEYSVRVLFGKPKAVEQNGTIISETIKFEPYTRNSGKLKGKTIMVNAGHGMKRQSSPQLDPGKPDAKDVNGKMIEEWRKNRDYADELIKLLRAEGATVIFTNGDAANACTEKKKYSCDLFISLHCNTNPDPKKRGLEAFYHNGATQGESLAGKIATKLNGVKKNDNTTRHGRLGVLTNIGPKACPSVLLEMGYLTSPHDIKNIDSQSDRKKKMTAVKDVIVDFLK